MKLRATPLFKSFLLVSTVILSTLFIVKINEHWSFKEHRQKSFSIAIISLHISTHPQAIIDRYISELNTFKEAHWQIKTFDAKLNRILLQSMIDEVLMGNYDLIYTIGTGASTLTQQHLHKRHKKNPMLFSSILKYVWEDWHVSNPNIDERCSGVYGSYDWPRRVKILKLLLPNVRHVIIPIPGNSSEYSYDNIKALKDELARQGIEGRIIDIENKSDGVQKLRPFLANTDAMILQREVLGLGFIDLILELAARAQVPTYSADANSVYAGGTIGLGIDETAPGVLNAHKTKQILLDRESVKDIPVDDLNEMGSRLIINEKRFKKLNPNADPRILFLARKGFLIRSTKKAS